jgi:hypothetical protein
MNGFAIGRGEKGRYTRQMGLGNTQEIWVSQKLTGPTVGAATAFEVVSIYKLTGATGRTGAGGLSGVNLKPMATGQAKVGSIITDTTG